MQNKRFIITLLLIFMLSSLFAIDLPTVTGKTFEPMSIRSMAMGGTGIAKGGRTDAYWLNPASLGDWEGQLSLPYLSLTVFNANRLLKDGFFSYLGKGDMANAGVKFVDSIKSGYQDLARLDTGITFNIAGFGIGVNMQLKMSTLGPGSVGSTVVAESNLVGSLGYGHKVEISDDLSISLGITTRFHYKAYTIPNISTGIAGGITASNLLGLFNDPSFFMSTLISSIPVAGGFSIPIDFGMSLTLPLDFYFGMAIRNINANFKNMQTYNGFSSLFYSLTGQTIGDKSTAESLNRFSYSVPWSLDFGFAWEPKEKGFFYYIRPSITFDFVDTVSFITNSLTFESFVSHLKMGIELRMLKVLDLRAGINQGYPSLGIGFDLFAFRCDVIYAIYEYGSVIGEKPLDALTIRFNIGFDR